MTLFRRQDRCGSVSFLPRQPGAAHGRPEEGDGRPPVRVEVGETTGKQKTHTPVAGHVLPAMYCTPNPDLLFLP